MEFLVTARRATALPRESKVSLSSFVITFSKMHPENAISLAVFSTSVSRPSAVNRKPHLLTLNLLNFSNLHDAIPDILNMPPAMWLQTQTVSRTSGSSCCKARGRQGSFCRQRARCSPFSHGESQSKLTAGHRKLAAETWYGLPAFHFEPRADGEMYWLIIQVYRMVAQRPGRRQQHAPSTTKRACAPSLSLCLVECVRARCMIRGSWDTQHIVLWCSL